jgi:hypothetical protein
MGLDKAEAIRQLNSRGSVSHQEALVKKIEGVKTIKPIKRIIPGGKDLANVAIEDMPMAVYTWLRACAHFTEGTISLCSSPDDVKAKRTRVVDFDTNTKNTEWEVRGKRWLADRIVDILKTKNILAVEIKRDGLYSLVQTKGKFDPTSENWEPYVELVPFRPPTF